MFYFVQVSKKKFFHIIYKNKIIILLLLEYQYLNYKENFVEKLVHRNVLYIFKINILEKIFNNFLPLDICVPLKANSSKSTSAVISIFPGSESASTTSCLRNPYRKMFTDIIN
jgi:hypothetical protein